MGSKAPAGQKLNAKSIPSPRGEGGQGGVAGTCINCPPNGISEGELDCGLPVDTVNGGCNSNPEVFGALSCGETVCGSVGTQNVDGTDTRDTDWYKLVLAAPTQITMTAEAEFSHLFGIVDNFGVDSCAGVTGFLQFDTGLGCQTSIVTSCLPAGTWYLFAATDIFNGVSCGAPYTLTVSCGDCAGACCSINGCQVSGETECVDTGGAYVGDGTTCTGDQNCCFADEDACVQRDPVCCALEGGVTDTEGPVVGNCPPAEVDIECDQPFPGFEPTFTDNCDTTLTPTGDCIVIAGDCPQERDIVCGVAAQDNCGNVSGCSTTFHVVDTTAPVVTCRELIVATCPGPNGIRPQDVPGLNDVSAVDNCDEEVPVGVTLPQVFSPTCDGAPHVVTWSATDDCGNVGSCETRVRVVGGMCCPTVTDTDLKLMVTDLDLRQDTNGPVTTKARFDIWNSNEVRFSGTEKCITCWNETLISEYVAISNHFLVENLQTDKGKARIQNEGSDVCPDSEDSPLLGVAIKEHTFLGSPHVEMRSAITLPGEGEQAATILYDIIGEPEEANTGRTGGLTISQVPSSGTRPTGPQMDDGTTVLGDGVVADNRASTMFKGSLIAFPVIEVKWDRHGQLIQDTFIQILNDNPGEVKVQFYQVNGDSPLDAVIDPNTNEIIERAHPGWNWSDYQITLTGDESCYFSVATGQPKGVSPIAVLDPGNPNGRPDLDPSNPGGRLIRGFLAAWAVNDDQHEIRWNHLKGHATVVRYDQATAWDYNPWNFRVVSGVPEGAESDATAGQLKLDGIEYDLAPETLIFDFYAAGATALSHPSVGP